MMEVIARIFMVLQAVRMRDILKQYLWITMVLVLLLLMFISITIIIMLSIIFIIHQLRLALEPMVRKYAMTQSL